MNKIVAVVGLCGSGKSEVVKFFVEKGWNRVYFGNVVISELKKKSLEINEQNEKFVREELRKEFGMAAMAVKSIDEIKKLYKYGNVVIESLYSWAEYKIIEKEFGSNFKLLNVHTSKDIRYKRLTERKVRPLTITEAISRDYSEIEKLEKGGPIAFCDYLIINDGTFEELRNKVSTTIEE